MDQLFTSSVALWKIWWDLFISCKWSGNKSKQLSCLIQSSQVRLFSSRQNLLPLTNEGGISNGWAHSHLYYAPFTSKFSIFTMCYVVLHFHPQTHACVCCKMAKVQASVSCTMKQLNGLVHGHLPQWENKELSVCKCLLWQWSFYRCHNEV